MVEAAKNEIITLVKEAYANLKKIDRIMTDVIEGESWDKGYEFAQKALELYQKAAELDTEGRWASALQKRIELAEGYVDLTEPTKSHESSNSTVDSRLCRIITVG